MVLVGGIVGGVRRRGVAGLRSAFQPNVMFFFDPSQIVAGEGAGPTNASVSAAWWRRAASRRRAGTLDVKFLVTDFKHTVPVKYSGILPDLFREGQGVVAHGRMQQRHVRRG